MSQTTSNQPSNVSLLPIHAEQMERELSGMMQATAAIEKVHGRKLEPQEASMVWLAYSIARVDAVREAQHGREDKREDQQEHRAEG